MDFDFAVNKTTLEFLIRYLGYFQEQFQDTIDGIFYGVGQMSLGMNGPDYKAFVENTEQYKDPLTRLYLFIYAYREVLSSQSFRVNNLVQKVKAEFERMSE